jgi:proton-translocating NADH-quinone oxidoreductase chain L
MYLNIIFLPLLSAFFNGFFGFLIGAQGASFLSTFLIFLSFLLSCFAFYEVGLQGSSCIITFLKWFDIDLFYANWAFHFDSLTVVMLIVVTFISFLVHLYSTEYMQNDPHIPRFMSYLSLFTFFMLILVSSDNFLQLFVGWEGVGLCSYLLINFWFTRIQANKAAIKAMLVNRIGDFGLALGIFAIFFTFHSVEFSVVFSLVPYYSLDTIIFFGNEILILNLIGYLLFIGAVGKSAQLGLHTWLPDAMEGPTPVSALIHAATMVTAGVFLLARCSLIFEYAIDSLYLITIIGAITCFFAASVGLLQNDLKKVIAYSTCSQLGYMIFACGLSHYSIAIFHLANHAFFKAALFLAAGSVIHAVADEQDMRKMGGLKKLIPFTFSIMSIGSLALAGFPFLSGFYSKDAILEIAYSSFTSVGIFAYWLGVFAALLTATYSMRVLYLTFISPTNGFKSIVIGAHDVKFSMGFPLFLLIICSILVGFYLKDLFIGIGTFYWNNSIYISENTYRFIDSEFIPSIYKLLPLFFSFTGLLGGFYIYFFFSKNLFKQKISYYGRFFYIFLNKKWFFDKIYNEILNQNLLLISYNITFKNLDRGLFEMVGPFGIQKTIKSALKSIDWFYIGNIYIHLFFIFLGIQLCVSFIILTSFNIFVLFDLQLFFIFFFSLFFIKS